MIANRYKVLKTLGSGATATVLLVRDVRNDRDFACKVLIDADSLEGAADAKKEMLIMGKLKHENVIKAVAIGRGPFDN